MNKQYTEMETQNKGDLSVYMAPMFNSFLEITEKAVGKGPAV